MRSLLEAIRPYSHMFGFLATAGQPLNQTRPFWAHFYTLVSHRPAASKRARRPIHVVLVYAHRFGDGLEGDFAFQPVFNKPESPFNRAGRSFIFHAVRLTGSRFAR